MRTARGRRGSRVGDDGRRRRSSSCSWATARPLMRNGPTSAEAPSVRPIGHAGSVCNRSATNCRLASGITIASPGLAASSGHRVSWSRWSVWLWLDVTTSIMSSRAGSTTRAVIRTCGLSVAGVLRRQRVGQVRVEEQVVTVPLDEEARLPEPPQPQRVSVAARPDATSARKSSSVAQRLDQRPHDRHASSLTPVPGARAARPRPCSASFCRAAQRAVWLRPQSGAKRQPLGRRVLQAEAHAVGDQSPTSRCSSSSRR